MKTIIKLSMVIAMSLTIAGCSSKEQKIELKQEIFKTSVLKDVDTSAATYFKDVPKNDKVTFVEKVKTDVLGTVTTEFTYKDNKYTIKFDVIDNEKPVIEISQKTFKFDVGTSAKDINAKIKKKITVKDNFDKNIKVADIIKADETKKEQTISKKIIVTDGSENKSNPITIKISFVKVKESSSSKTNSTTNQSSNNSTGSNKTSSTKKNTGSTTNKGSSSSGNTTANKPSSKPSKPSYDPFWENPDGSCHHMHRKAFNGMWFNSGEELEDYAENYILEHPEVGVTCGGWHCRNCGKWCITIFS